MSGEHPESDAGHEGETRQRRRRPRRPLMIDNTVPSPCLSICRFDGEPYCVGCYRNADEIREWIIMTAEQKLEVLAKLAQRKKAAGIA